MEVSDMFTDQLPLSDLLNRENLIEAVRTGTRLVEIYRSISSFGVYSKAKLFEPLLWEVSFPELIKIDESGKSNFLDYLSSEYDHIYRKGFHLSKTDIIALDRLLRNKISVFSKSHLTAEIDFLEYTHTNDLFPDLRYQEYGNLIFSHTISNRKKKRNLSIIIGEASSFLTAKVVETVSGELISVVFVSNRKDTKISIEYNSKADQDCTLFIPIYQLRESSNLSQSYIDLSYGQMIAATVFAIPKLFEKYRSRLEELYNKKSAKIEEILNFFDDIGLSLEEFKGWNKL